MEKLAGSTFSSGNIFQAALQDAQAAVQKQDFMTAEIAFRQALTQQKTSVIALAGLGQSLCQLHRGKEGIPLLCQAGALLLKQAKQTKDSRHVLDIAYQLLHWHAPEEALTLVKASLAIPPNSANAQHIAALCLQSLNKHAEAYAYASRAVEFAPNDANANILLAVLSAKLNKLPEARQRLEFVINSCGGAAHARAHMELGVVLDKMGEFTPAFQHLSAAGQLSLQTPETGRMDKQAVFRDIAEYKAAFNPVFLQSAADRLPEDGLPAPVFLIGFFRSGTTLAEQILAAHAQVVSSDEAQLIPVVLAEMYKITQPGLSLAARIQSLGKAEIAQLRQHYWQTAAALFGEQVLQKVLIDKTALNILNIELINTLFPNALLLFSLRDPRDVCLSCFMQPFGLTALTANFLSWTDTARFYALIMDYWLSIRDSLSLRWFEVRYEDMVNDMEGQFRPLFTEMGLEWTAECNEFYLHAQRRVIRTPSFDQVTKPLYHTSVNRWQNYETQFAEILPVLKPFIESFGYAVA